MARAAGYDWRARGFAMLVARRYVISGRVQGVGFRFFVEAAAMREGVSGWAKNLPDGRVEVAAEGDAEAMNRFDGHVRRGPPRAHVDAVVVDDVPPTGQMSGFSVK
jgi:acylphosphatase